MAASFPGIGRAVARAFDGKGAVVFAAGVGFAVVAGACGGSAPDPRYPERAPGCAVQKFGGSPELQVDDLGTLRVDCDSAGPSCERRLLDAVCARGGDVAWGLGDNALSATRVTAHAAHTKRAIQGARERGCAVRVFADAPNVPTENVGPVSALCAEGDARDVCVRELEDQVCLLGGDVLWQVEGPAAAGDKVRMRGRAAHTR